MKRLWSQTLKVFLPTTGLLFLLCETLTQSWTFDTLSRRDALLIAGGGVVYGKVAGDALARLAENTNGLGEIRPSEHEDRVKQTFLRAVELAPPDGYRPLQVLEVGVGTECQSLQRGYYSKAIDFVRDGSLWTGMRLTGIDLNIPNDKIVQRVKAQFENQVSCATSNSWTFDVVQGSADAMPFDNISFDVVMCCLVLCSVQTQQGVLREIQRILRPGGTLGYIEHVAVEPEDGRPFFEWQQTTLDPLQQLVAHNCHLHRSTVNSIANVFGDNNMIEYDRFYVDKMWPVCCQASGVIRKI